MVDVGLCFERFYDMFYMCPSSLLGPQKAGALGGAASPASTFYAKIGSIWMYLYAYTTMHL